MGRLNSTTCAYRRLANHASYVRSFRLESTLERLTACGKVKSMGMLVRPFLVSTFPWNSYPGPLLNNGNGPIDFRRVAIHELGHTIGLADINGTNPLGIMDIDVSNIYYLTSDDVAGAQALYGAPANPASNGKETLRIRALVSCS
jgi:hypothetical protein